MRDGHEIIPARKARARRTGPKPYELDSYVPYLLNHIGGRLAMKISEDVRMAGLTLTAWRVLHTLWHTGPLKLAPLADKANFDLSTLSRVVSDLERRGLLRRANHGRSQRPAIELTRKGAACVEALLPSSATLEKKMLAILSPGEAMLLVELLKKLNGQLGQMGFARPAPPAGSRSKT